MAATVTIKQKIKLGNTESLYIGEATLDSSYATGGELLNFVTASGQPGPEKMHWLAPAQSGGYVAEFIPASQKIKVFRDNGTATAAPLPEVASAVDLSALVLQFAGIGPS